MMENPSVRTLTVVAFLIRSAARPGVAVFAVPGAEIVADPGITGRAPAEYRPGVLPSLIESHHTTVVNCGPALGQFTLMSQVEPVGKLGNQSLDGTRACT